MPGEGRVAGHAGEVVVALVERDQLVLGRQRPRGRQRTQVGAHLDERPRAPEPGPRQRVEVPVLVLVRARVQLQRRVGEGALVHALAGVEEPRGEVRGDVGRAELGVRHRLDARHVHRVGGVTAADGRIAHQAVAGPRAGAGEREVEVGSLHLLAQVGGGVVLAGAVHLLGGREHGRELLRVAEPA
ncbi:hypothetical protein AB0383_33410 [Amycolatopsis sp. NPDC051373]|uniref:hypothetical protein n=1 Tax=Amycolatopsis sp. NPDC051373 TaxID=3155801 RepID=UPI00344E16E6